MQKGKALKKKLEKKKKTVNHNNNRQIFDNRTGEGGEGEGRGGGGGVCVCVCGGGGGRVEKYEVEQFQKAQQFKAGYAGYDLQKGDGS